MQQNFNLTEVTGQVTGSNRLRGWEIHTVQFKGVEFVTGKSKEGKDWTAMKIKFGNDKGIFEHQVFCPANDDSRRSGETNGKKWELPSGLESLSLTVAYLCRSLDPELYEKNKSKFVFELPAQFEKLVAFIGKLLERSINKTTQLKLVCNNKGYAQLPQFIRINRDGDVYLADHWLGDCCSFSDYEMTQMKKQKDAKPTDMGSIDGISVGVSDIASVNNNLDLDVDIDI